MKSNAEVSINNIYRLDGRVPLGKAIPFGLQHVLAMFVANLTPIVIVTAAAGLETSQTAALIQNAMLDRKSTRLNSSHIQKSRMPSSA